MDQRAKIGNMQTTIEITESHPTSCDDENKLPSLVGQGRSHLSVSQPSPGSGGPTFKPKAGGRSPSGKGFLKRKFPSWLKRKGPAHAPQGLVVSRSRLCAEATHESPIQAVRKPTQRNALGLDAEEGSTREKTGPSLLRKLWCLKATDSKLKKPPLRSDASPLQRPRCGPVTALSRTADPHGESPLRWKPRAETQSPEDGSLTEPEKAETVNQLDTSCLAKPWRTFRTMMAARAKKGSVLSGNERNPGATGGKVLSLPAELETLPATSASNTVQVQNNVVAIEDKTPPSTPPSVADELCGSREDERANQTPQHRLESHRRTEAILKPVPKLPAREENSCCKDSPILEIVSEPEGIQTEVCYFPGGRKLEAGGAGRGDEGPEQGDDRHWPELSAGEDLAELAENPGGQGMVMATRGWLNSEGLGGPKVEGKAAVSSRSHPNTQGIEQKTVFWADSSREIKHFDEHASSVSPDRTSRAGCLFLPALSGNGTSRVVTSHPSGPTTPEEVGPSYPVFSQEVNSPAILEPCPSGELERGAEGSPTSSPVQTADLDPLGENSSPPRSPTWQQMPSPTEPPRATSWPSTAGPEEKQKRLIYVAAVEIVEAAIDAAAEQLAKKKEREKTGLRGQEDVKADTLAGAATQQ